MKKKTAKRTSRKAIKQRDSLDTRLLRLSPHKAEHQLFFGRPDNGGYIEQELRCLWTLLRAGPEQTAALLQAAKDHPELAEEKARDIRYAQELQTRTQETLTAFAAAGFRPSAHPDSAGIWRPDVLEFIAAKMRQIEAEPDPLLPQQLPHEHQMRLLLFHHAKRGPVNARQLALQINRVKDALRMSDNMARNVETTRRNLLNIAMRYGIKTAGKGRPRKMEN